MGAARDIQCRDMAIPQDHAAEVESRFEWWRQRSGLFLGPLLAVVVWFLPMPGLSPQAHALVSVLAITIVFWVTEAIPMAATALLGPALCIVLGVGKDREVLAAFGNPITFLFIGSFLLAEGMQKHGLDRRIALTLMCLPGVAKSPTRVIIALGTLTALLSMWMSNTAITAVMIPIAIGIVRAAPAFANTRGAASGLMLMIAFSASIGGLATPVGTPTNLVAIGALEAVIGQRLSFLQWMSLAVPLMLALIGFLFLLLRPRGITHASFHQVAQELHRQRAALGPLTAGQVNCAIAFATALTLWMYPGLVELLIGKGQLGAAWLQARMPEETVGLVVGLSLFMLPVSLPRWEFTINWKDAAKIDWGTVLLFGGGLVLGKQIFDTGLATAIGQWVNATLGNPSVGLLSAIAIVLSIALSEATSNTASANVMVPMMIAVAQGAGVNPVPVALAACLACSFGFMLPISTPPNALAYSTGLVRLPQMIRAGILLDIVGAVAIWLIVHFLAPVLGWK
jgi:sodium-dependent dicarboxylate transporter 2/3/5